MEELFVRYLHFVGFILLASMLVAENLLLARSLDNRTLKKLAAIDGIYGLSAVITLGAGLTLWLGVGKPAEFYNANPIFHIKVTLFVVVALLSIYPTIFLLKHRNTSAAELSVPAPVVLVKRLEVVFLLLIPLLAVLMARGVGLG